MVQLIDNTFQPVDHQESVMNTRPLRFLLILVAACGEQTNASIQPTVDNDLGTAVDSESHESFFSPQIDPSVGMIDHELPVSAAEAQQIVWDTYPDLDFGEDVMFGPEEVDGTWILGYMLSAITGPDIFEVIVDANTGEIVKEVALEGYGARAASCVVSGVALGAWYSQRDVDWADELLGNSSSTTIGAAGCVITSIAMTYENVWSTPTDPFDLNDAAVDGGCFGAGSPNVDVSCAINAQGGPHSVSSISMSSVATAICAGYPVMVDTTWGGGHKMLVYSYNGGSTSSMGSYKAVDPWYGTSKSLSGYTATRWRKFY